MPFNSGHMKRAYFSMLDPLKEQFFSKELTCMPVAVGKKYGQAPIRLMYVGRAVNGWNDDWRTGTTEELVEQVFEHTQNMSIIEQGVVEYRCGDEICTYNYNRSPFWQLCRALLKLYGIEKNWADYVAWTNLFKVSPAKTGNPGNELIGQTISDCADILFYEISCERPTHIVFVTDEWWMKPTGKGIKQTAFVDKLGIDTYEETNGNMVIGSGVVGNEYFHFPNAPRPKYVITKRPESAKGSRVEQAKAIYDAFVEMNKGEQD